MSTPLGVAQREAAQLGSVRKCLGSSPSAQAGPAVQRPAPGEREGAAAVGRAGQCAGDRRDGVGVATTAAVLVGYYALDDFNVPVMEHQRDTYGALPPTTLMAASAEMPAPLARASMMKDRTVSRCLGVRSRHSHLRVMRGEADGRPVRGLTTPRSGKSGAAPSPWARPLPAARVMAPREAARCDLAGALGAAGGCPSMRVVPAVRVLMARVPVLTAPKSVMPNSCLEAVVVLFRLILRMRMPLQ